MKYVSNPTIGKAVIDIIGISIGFSKVWKVKGTSINIMNDRSIKTESAALADFPVISDSRSSSWIISGRIISFILMRPLWRFFDWLLVNQLNINTMTKKNNTIPVLLIAFSWKYSKVIFRSDNNSIKLWFSYRKIR